MDLLETTVLMAFEEMTATQRQDMMLTLDGMYCGLCGNESHGGWCTGCEVLAHEAPTAHLKEEPKQLELPFAEPDRIPLEDRLRGRKK